MEIARPSWGKVDPLLPGCCSLASFNSGTSLDQAPLCHNHVWQEAQHLLWGFGWWVTDGRAGEGVEGTWL